MNRSWLYQLAHQWSTRVGLAIRSLALVCALLAGQTAQAQTYAYRNEVFSYDIPTAAATNVPWHAGTDSTWLGTPACTQYPNGDDDWSDIAFPGGFTFRFGGTSYSSVRVYSNGMLAFPTDVSGFHRNFTSQALPITAAGPGTQGGGCTLTAIPKNLMMVYWLDIVAGVANSTAGASVKYEILGASPSRRFVISWVNVKLFNKAARYNFQVTLYESAAGVNGNFRYQYTSGSSDGSGATVGVQLTTTDFTQYVYNQNFIDTSVGTAILWYPANQLASKIAEYRFDEGAWTGVAGEIKDTSGNSRNASKVGLVTSVAPLLFPGGKLCRGGSFPTNLGASATTIDAVATPVTPSNQGSVDFWFNSNVAWNASGSDAVLLDATTVANRPFFLMKLASGALKFVVTDNAGNTVTSTSPVSAFAANTWHHIGVAWNVRNGTNQTVLQIFLDGVLQNGAPTRGNTNGIMPALSSIYIGDNRTSGVTPAGGTTKSANGSIDEVYVYDLEISAPQALADKNLTRANCTALDHFHIIHDGTTSSCTAPAVITIEAHDSTHALFSLAGTTMNLSTTPARGTWSNVALGAVNALTSIVAGSGTASYSFANESIVKFGLSDSQSGALNINVASGLVTERTGAAALCVPKDYTNPSVTTCDDSRNFLCAAFGFNCIESGADALAGRLYTKLAGAAFAFDVVALKDADNNGAADGVETLYASDADKSVTVELVDGSGATACTDRTPVVPAVSQTLTFVKANQGRKKTADMTVTKAYPDLRCRVTQAPGIVGCSTDNFAVRPSAVTLVTAATAAAPSRTNTPIIRTGANFTLQATTSAGGNYAGTLTLDTTSAPPAAVKLTAQNTTQDATQAAGGVLGTLTPATLIGNAAAVNATYSEVGYLYLAPGAYRDDAFTAVDRAGDDCVTSTTGDANLSDVVAGGKYGCSIGNKTAVSLGRFVPHHFTVTSPVFAPGCAGGSYTYMAQPFTLTAAIEAQSATNALTKNYSGVFAPGVVSTQAENNNNSTALGSRVSFTAPWAAGTASYSATRFSRPITTVADATWGSFDALAIGVRITDPDAVLLINRNMDESTGTVCTPDTTGTSDGACPAVSLTSGAKVRFGRLRLWNAYGSELLGLSVPLEAQFWNGSAFVRNPLDTCTSLAPANVNLINHQGGINTTNMGAGHVTSVASFAAGSSRVTLSKPSPAPTALGSLDVILNLGSAGAPISCPTTIQASPLGTTTSAALPFLSGNWCNAAAFDRDPTARATFGVFKSPLIYRRENY